MPQPFIIAQITDCHVSERGSPFEAQFESGAHLSAAVHHIMRLDPRPNIVIATGDLIHEGQREEYEYLSETLSPLSMPVYLVPGNHDDRDNMRSVFADHQYLPEGPFLNYLVDEYPLRLLLLDTLIPGETGGELCVERLAWLEEKLDSEPDRPTFIAMHHPPFLTGILPFDRNRNGYGLIGADLLGNVIARHPQVERIICGHIHRPISTNWYGTTVSVAPSTSHQIELDLVGDRLLTLIKEPPAVDLHVWIPNGSLISHRSYVGEYPEVLRVNMPSPEPA